jgi:hypothetical protein
MVRINRTGLASSERTISVSPHFLRIVSTFGSDVLSV